MVLAYEDLQWVTSDTRDFLDAFTRQLPPSTLVLLTYRPEYDAAWIADRERLELRLDGLAPAATRQMITDLLGADESLAALKDELPKRSGGNPLFIEEYVRSMVEAGELQGQPGRFRLGKPAAGTTTIPPTVRGVLAARIDRLARADKHVLQTIAAIGEDASVDSAGARQRPADRRAQEVAAPAGNGGPARRARRRRAVSRTNSSTR